MPSPPDRSPSPPAADRIRRRTTPAPDFNGQTNVGTNFAPAGHLLQAHQPDRYRNSGTLLLYNNDSGKYIERNGHRGSQWPERDLHAHLCRCCPTPTTTSTRHGGYYDADGNYLNGIDSYFTTGAGTDTTPPTVSIRFAGQHRDRGAAQCQVVVQFSAPINANNTNVITVTPSGGSAIAGTSVAGQRLVTLTFVPTTPLQADKVYTVSGERLSRYGRQHRHALHQQLYHRHLGPAISCVHRLQCLAET